MSEVGNVWRETMSPTSTGPFAKLPDWFGNLDARSAFVASQKSGNRAMVRRVASTRQTPDIPNLRWSHPDTKKPQSRNAEADLKRSLATVELTTAAEEQAEEAKAQKHQA